MTDEMNRKLAEMDKKYELELSKIQNMIDTEFGLVDDEEMIFDDTENGDQPSQLSARPVRKVGTTFNNQISTKYEEPTEKEEDKEGGQEGSSSADPKRGE